MKRFGIPLSYLTKMGIYDNVTLLGMGGVKVLTANCADVLEKHITVFIDVVRRQQIKVVGVDVKRVQSKGNKAELLVMFAGFCSLIFDVTQIVSESFSKFVKDDSICFVAATDAVKKITFTYRGYPSPTSTYQNINFNISCVLVGDLAVMVLKKAEINNLSLAEIGGVVGVSYDKKVLSNSASETIILDMVHPLVFTEGKIETVISDACACYQIGQKLLSSL